MPTPPELFTDKYDLADNIHLLDDQELAALDKSLDADPVVKKAALREKLSRLSTGPETSSDSIDKDPQHSSEGSSGSVSSNLKKELRQLESGKLSPGDLSDEALAAAYEEGKISETVFATEFAQRQ
jgi:hypothetical protein